MDKSKNWIDISLEDVADLTVGFVGKTTNHYVNNGIRFLRSQNVEPFRINLADERFIDEPFHRSIKKSQLEAGDVVIVRTGNPGASAVIPEKNEEWNCSDLVIIKPDHTRINSTFLAAFLNLSYGVISSNLVGAVQQHYNVGAAKKLRLKLPSLKEQNIIASYIDSLNEKITINEKINQNLQEQARTIYSNMIVDNADETWTRGTLSDVAIVTMGQSPKGDTYNEDGNGTVFFQGRAEFGFRFPTRRLYTTDPKRMAQANDALMSVRAPVGDMNVAYEDCCIGRGLSAIRSKDGHQSFVLYTMFDLRDQLDVFNGEGTVFGSINRDALNSMPIKIPPQAVLDSFEAVVAPMDQAIRNNCDEICRLTNIRDCLLPRLMSGELDVSEIEI
ncbi:restriction endonuclease subunit S [Butyrivibrio sp. AE2032]|uniref:restriction endonuclease subunit S n=1 Tax=Butyrivibrio sp. AE2032 TaxID=1458463 RepID=UPI0009DFD232|nr:restriction endonuclease subunit S [Butyrivibrio sp. AE2032]